MSLPIPYKLPLDVSDFETLRKNGYIYVDKTKILYDLINQGRLYFVTRPRRFGKSLMLSTFRAIFTGNKDLFAGLWIASSDYAWPKHPVLYLDFSTIAFDNYEEFILNFNNVINIAGQFHGVDLSEAQGATAKLLKIALELFKKAKVVVLIDEYDKILYDKLKDPVLAKKISDSLADFFSVLKSLDSYIQFVCVTGVSNFARTSLLSGMNTLVDISLASRASTLLGYTHLELDKHFGSFIQRWSQEDKIEMQELRSKLIEWYDGYRFCSDGELVFNPVSIAYALYNKKIINYWSQTGVTSYLVSRVIKERTPLPIFQTVTLTSHELLPLELGKLSAKTLLFQAGYLTIAGYNAATDTYTMKYPNTEIEESFQKDILQYYTEIALSSINDNYTPLARALMRGDVQDFCEQFKPVLAHIPYQLQIPQEAYYHSMFQAIVAMLPGRSFSEVQTDTGRMDMCLETQDYIYIFEFKLKKSAQKALRQIHKRKYFERFSNAGKPIVLIGLAFNPDQVGLDYEYQIERLS